MATVDSTRPAPGRGPRVAARARKGPQATEAGGAVRGGASSPIVSPAAQAFGGVLAAAGEDDAVDVVLALAAGALCRLLAADRCTVYVADGDTGRYGGRVGHPAGLDAVLRRLTVGGPGDDLVATLTAERTPRPLTADPRDRQDDGCDAVRRQHAGAVLAVPFPAPGSTPAIAFVEDRDRRRAFAPHELDTGREFGALLGRWLGRAGRAERLDVTREALARERAALRRVALVEQRLGTVLGRGPEALLTAVSGVLGRALELRDASGDLVVRGAPRDGAPAAGPATVGAAAIGHAVDGLQPGETRVALLRPGGDPCLVTPARTADGSTGLLALILDGGRAGRADPLVLVRAAGALETAASTSDDEASPDRSAIFAQVLGGVLDDGERGRLARRLPRAAGVLRLVVVCAGAGDVADRVLRALPVWRATGVALADGPVVVVDVPDAADPRAAAVAVRDRLVASAVWDEDARVVVSAPAADPRGLQRAVREARGALRLLAGPVATVHELGPARLLVTAPEDAADLAAEILGPLLDPSPSARDLLDTLVAYVAAGRNLTASAAGLGLHVNSVRHRFGRIHAATGYDVLGDVDDQLTVQAALAGLRASPSPVDGATTV